jgi:hypothetical protein
MANVQMDTVQVSLEGLLKNKGKKVQAGNFFLNIRENSIDISYKGSQMSIVKVDNVAPKANVKNGVVGRIALVVNPDLPAYSISIKRDPETNSLFYFYTGSNNPVYNKDRKSNPVFRFLKDATVEKAIIDMLDFELNADEIADVTTAIDKELKAVFPKNEVHVDYEKDGKIYSVTGKLVTREEVQATQDSILRQKNSPKGISEKQVKTLEGTKDFLAHCDDEVKGYHIMYGQKSLRTVFLRSGYTAADGTIVMESAEPHEHQLKLKNGDDVQNEVPLVDIAI